MQENSNINEETPCCGNSKDEMQQHKPINWPLILSLISLVVSLALLVLFLTPGKNSQTVTNSSDKITIAWINTDTIWENYEFVADVKAELADLEQKLQNQYAATVNSFQQEYDNYIKQATAGLLTLDQQKKTEEKLAQKQQSITELDAKLTQQLVDAKTIRNIEVHDTIVNFIARFNESHNYTFIMERSYGGGLLFADSTLEVTDAVLKGLNEEYKYIKKSKEEAFSE